MRMLYLIPLLALVFLPACRQEADRQIVGAKIYAWSGDYTNLFSQWNSLGINTAFVSQELISIPEFRTAAKARNISTFIIFPVFFNPEELARSPSLYAITSKGDPAKEEWVEFVCPSRTAYREQLVEKAVNIIRDFDPDGLSIDFIRHFVFWEKVYPDQEPSSLPVTCFDSTCLADFQSVMEIHIPDSLNLVPQKSHWILKEHPREWIRWRCGLITSMVKEISEAARKEKPEIRINVHLVPWSGDDFQNGRERVAGQDVGALSAYSDYLSPMTYAHMVKQPPSWIHSVVDDLYLQTGSQILPSIQVDKAYLDTDLDLQEFEQSLAEALRPPSDGVILWSWERISGDPEKVTVLMEALSRAPGP
jgi:hypothetical protein